MVKNSPDGSPYATEHFLIHYDHATLSSAQVEKIGLGKEKLLEHVTDYLALSYDGRIEVYIYDTLVTPHASGSERIWESTSYALSDDGHEIAHVVHLNYWGGIFSSFLMEGIAVAASLRGGDTAIRDYARSLFRYGKSQGAVDHAVASLKEGIIADWWSERIWSYTQAGAFTHFLKVQYGWDAINGWYMGVGSVWNADMAGEFAAAFGVTLDSALVLFGQRLMAE